MKLAEMILDPNKKEANSTAKHNAIKDIASGIKNRYKGDPTFKFLCMDAIYWRLARTMENAPFGMSNE